MEPHRVHIAGRDDVWAPGGLNRVVRELSFAQARMGFRTSVLHSLGDKHSQVLSSGPITACRSPVAVAHEFHFAQTVRHAERLLGHGSPVRIFHFHGPWYLEGKLSGDSLLRRVLKQVIERVTYRGFDLLTTHSEAFKTLLCREFRVQPERVIVVPLGVDSKTFRPGDSPAAREELRLPQGGFLFGTVRRLYWRMGLETAIRALGHLEGASLVIGGAGPARGRLEELSRDLSLRHRVIFLGALDESALITLYQACDALLVPSVALEGFGLVVLEAMACGKPVVSSDSGGLPEAMGPFADNWCFPRNEPRGLSELMYQMMGNPPQEAELLAHARRMTWERVASEVERALAHE